MLVYVAAPYPAREYVESLFPVLAEAGHECTSNWALGSREIHAGTVGASTATEPEDALRHAVGDLFDVGRSRAFVILTAGFCIAEAGVEDRWLHTGGRQVELGYALANRLQQTIVVGEPENIFQRTLCVVVPDMSSAISALA